MLNILFYKRTTYELAAGVIHCSMQFRELVTSLLLSGLLFDGSFVVSITNKLRESVGHIEHTLQADVLLAVALTSASAVWFY